MSRPTRRPILFSLLLLLAAIVVALLLVPALEDGLEEGPDDRPEATVARVARQRQPATVAPGTVVELGSGASVRGEWYELHVNNPRYPDDPNAHRGGLDARLVELVDRATRTVDVAVYDFDLANVAEALARAAGRGVTVRLVTDTDTLTNTKDDAVQAAFARLKRARIPIVDDQRADIMHHKFTVVDGEWVSTGSWNYTDGDTYRLNNHMVIMRSRELAANYQAEFEKMFTRRLFGPNKPRTTPNPVLAIGGTRVQNAFSPQDATASRVIDAVKGSRRSIYFLAFSFTHNGIGQAIVERSKAGVAVGGVFETTGSNTSFSQYGRMKREGLDVYQDGNPWALHHKVIVVDERTAVLGSFNFSNNAERNNDENLLIVEDPALARGFKAEFDKLLAVAKNPPVRKRS